MSIRKLLEEKEAQIGQRGYIEFSEDELKSLNYIDLRHILDVFQGHALMKLPASEIRFFEWLKETDRAVWDDLWADADDEAYLVSINYLSHFIGRNLGFPICDLVDEPNYWFSPRHIKPKGREELDDIFLKVEQDIKLTLAEYFLYSLHSGSFDIWHFCYEHNLDLSTVKTIIEDLVYKGQLVHLTRRDDLVQYLDFD